MPCRALSFAALLLLGCASTTPSPEPSAEPEPFGVPAEGPRLLIRSDDMGFSHASNVANRQLLETGLPVNVSVLFCAPWYREAVAILKEYPHAAVGVHLCANSEWADYKWGPVAGPAAVPSLVNEEGHFFGSYAELNVDNNPAVEDLETEFRAQIERALRSGLTISYLDSHMGAGQRTAEQRTMLQRLADAYGLPLSGFNGEARIRDVLDGSYEQQRQNLHRALAGLSADSLYLMVFHLGTDTPELQAMQDLNPGVVAEMAAQRDRERRLLTDPALPGVLRRYGVRLVTYRDPAFIRSE